VDVCNRSSPEGYQPGLIGEHVGNPMTWHSSRHRLSASRRATLAGDAALLYLINDEQARTRRTVIQLAIATLIVR
jgi:hypothetical protein